MPNKLFSVTVTMPDLAAAHAEQEARVESSTWAAAVRLACDEISKRPHVRGKHIKSAKIYFTIIDNQAKADFSRKPDAPPKQAPDEIQGFLFEV